MLFNLVYLSFPGISMLTPPIPNEPSSQLHLQIPQSLRLCHLIIHAPRGRRALAPPIRSLDEHRRTQTEEPETLENSLSDAIKKGGEDPLWPLFLQKCMNPAACDTHKSRNVFAALFERSQRSWMDTPQIKKCLVKRVLLSLERKFGACLKACSRSQDGQGFQTKPQDS